MRDFVVVSGLPASGKSTLAARLAVELGAVHLDKDDFLETLLEGEPIPTNERRGDLSRRADAQLRDAAMAREFAILSSWWRHPGSDSPSGTDTEWLRQAGTRVIEVHCRCPAREAVDRFVTRRRHPGHLDSLRTPPSLLAQFEAAERLGPLFPDDVLVWDTAADAPAESFDALVRAIRQRLDPAA